MILPPIPRNGLGSGVAVRASRHRNYLPCADDVVDPPVPAAVARRRDRAFPP
jgi:hypothetical protein